MRKPASPPKELYVAEWRALRGLTQQQLADRLDTSKGWVSNVETGARGYTPAALRRIAAALDIQVAQLFNPPPTNDPVDNVALIWERIPEADKPRALRVLKEFARDDDDSAA
jgi:transcriptional regulator with XRE-family HTH domain